MKLLSITEVKADFYNLMKRVAAGEEITITKYGVPAARLEPVKRKLGLYRGAIKMAEDFDAPLSPETFLPEKLGRKKSGKKH
jgi:prevent-host-death family protein